jgi:hypothetical protein
MVGRIPKWLLGFEQRINERLKSYQLQLDLIHNRLNVMLNSSKEAREDNLATLPAIREAVHDCVQLMHLYQTHFDELTARLALDKPIERLMVNPKPREAMSTYAPRCADTRKPEGVPETTQWQTMRAPFDPEKFAADALNRAFSPSAPCSFAHLHRHGIKCAVCEVTP